MVTTALKGFARYWLLRLAWGVFVLGLGTGGWGAEVQILSLSHDGLLVWTNASLNTSCRVEWASSAAGPWFSSWPLTNILVTNHEPISVAVPMFYRVVSTPAQLLVHVTPEEFLNQVTNHLGHTNYVILDVRTPGEFEWGHVKAGTNIDYYSASFETELSQLDREKVYLLYCASGSRSSAALITMRRLGFRTVYNLLNGFWSLSSLPEASPYLEP
jgi:rhodanese-related sulfurtransferase